jgi:hypothetical protein
MSNPYTPAQAQRRYLEDIIAELLLADDHLRCASMALTHRMRTDEEARIASELNQGRCAVQRVWQMVRAMHPDAEVT